MRIAILYSSYEGSNETTRDLEPARDPSRYLPEHECRHFPITRQRALREVIDVQRQEFDVVINLCDGSCHGDTAGIEVVNALEQLNMAFTGSGSALYDPSREAMKMACHAAGVAFPAYVIVTSVHDVNRAQANLRFPMLVKRPQGYSSVGLTRASLVTDAESLKRQVEITLDEFGAALVEEFIEGREFTVLVTEPRDAREEAWALTPVEFSFPPGESFKHFDLKWIRHEEMTAHPVADPSLSERLKNMAVRTFKALGCNGYARCDIRADRAGELYLLEINPNCSLFYPEGQFGSGDLILAADPAGHRGFLEHQIECARRRRQNRERPWGLSYFRDRGFAMMAKRPIAAGELVERYEERAATLVSREYAERNWRGDRRRWLDRYGWPVTDETYVIWSRDPDDWRPINHSCDPNTWLDGLDVVARRSIPAGEELTIDYATFCGPGMEQFECTCRTAECRHVITGSDYLLPTVRDRYHGHVSDYIRTQIQQSQNHDGPGFAAGQSRHGLGVVAGRAYNSGEILCAFKWGEMHDKPTVHSLQAGEQRHAEPRPFLLRYINHSCEPNVIFDIEAMAVRAVRDVQPGDELTFFYPATEWEMTQPFQCECGWKDCLGWIAGASHIPAEVLARYQLTGVVWQRSLNQSHVVEHASFRGMPTGNPHTA